MKYYGNLELINSSILGLHIEEVDTLDIDTADANRLISKDGILYFNTGTGYRVLQFSESEESSPLINTLGDWVNDDLSFNPVPFNALNNISGLSAEDNLLSVISQLDQAISNVSTEALSDLEDVVVNSPINGEILLYISDVLVNIGLENAIENYGNIRLSSLKDYASTGIIQDDDVLIWRSDDSKFTNKKVFFRVSGSTSTTEYVITHNIGVKYCFVEVFDKLTNKKISSSDYEVTYNSDSALTVILNTATIAEILVFAL